MSTGWRVEVDADRCTGSGLCAGIEPAHFTVVNGRSQPPPVPVDPDDMLLAAAECCPMEAISIIDTATGQRLFPEE